MTMDTNEAHFQDERRMECFMKITFLCARHAFLNIYRDIIKREAQAREREERKRKLRKHENREFLRWYIYVYDVERRRQRVQRGLYGDDIKKSNKHKIPVQKSLAKVCITFTNAIK